MSDPRAREDTERGEATETCRRCGLVTTEWTAVMAVRTAAILDEIEITDADPLTVVCADCAARTEAGLRLAVTNAVARVDTRELLERAPLADATARDTARGAVR